MFVMVIAVLTHALMGWPNVWLRIISRVLVLPLIAGLSYELLKWAGRSDNWLVKILSLPGIYLQKLTTREPSEKQLEVAIAAMKAVLPGNKTPYYEGLCDLNGEPLKNETAAGESNAAAEPVAIAGDSAADKPAAVQTGMDGEESEMAGEENPTVPKENDNELTS